MLYLETFLLCITVATCALIRFLLLLVLLYLKRKGFQSIPSAPVDSFYKGHVKTLKRAKANNYILDLFAEWQQRYGQTVAFFTWGRSLILTSDPDILKHITTDLKNFRKLNRLPNRSFRGQRLAGWNSILTGGGTNWAAKRKIMNQFFGKTNMDNVFSFCKPYLDSYLRKTLMPKVGQGKTLELVEELTLIFLSFPLCLGVEEVLTPEETARNLIQILKMISKPNEYNFLQKVFFAADTERINTTKMIIDMRAKLWEHTAQRMEELKHEDEIKPSDILGHLIRANEACNFERGEVISCIVDDLMTLYLVLDNNVKQIASMMLHLNKYPTVYAKLVKEVRCTEITDLKSLTSLVYTEKVILESLRMSPALLRGTRKFVSEDEKPQQFGGYRFPSGTHFTFSQYLIHHDNEIWENAEMFNPDRWTPDFKTDPFTYIPFLVGPRACLGKHFAMLTMKLVITALLRNFDIEERFNENAKPVIDRGRALLRIKNRVNYHFSPAIQGQKIEF